MPEGDVAYVPFEIERGDISSRTYRGFSEAFASVRDEMDRRLDFYRLISDWHSRKGLSPSSFSF